MSPSSVLRSRKRKRPVTSCSECYRRKQKCDRELPCAICTIRGIPEKCVFDTHIESDGTNSVPSPKRAVVLPTEAVSTESEGLDSGLVPPSDIDVQIGYTSAANSNFGILQKDNTALPDHRTKHGLPHFIVMQISNIEKQLPPRVIQLKLMNHYFQECWWWFSSLEPTSFRQRFDRWHTQMTTPSGWNEDDGKDHPYFSALLFQSLAVALQYVHPGVREIWEALQLCDHKSADHVSIKYSKAGMQVMDLLGRHDSTLTAVQHDIMRGIWLKNTSRGTESWYSLGNAIRQAQELNLHKRSEPPPTIHDADLSNWIWQDQLSQRVWVCLFNWDAHGAFTLGRPRIINANDCDTMNLIPDDSNPTHIEPFTRDGEKPSFVEPIVFHYSLAHLIHEMLNLNSSSSSAKARDTVADLQKKVDNLLQSLPAYFRIQKTDFSLDTTYPALPSMRFHLFTIAQTYLTALHRAHVFHSVQSCEAAITAATKVLDSEEKLFAITDKHRWRIYTYSFYTIDAAIFLAALLLEQPMTMKEHQVEDIKAVLWRALDRLQKMQEVSTMAKTGMQILRRCQTRIQKQASLMKLPTMTTTSTSSTSGTFPEADAAGLAVTPHSNENTSADQVDNVASPSFRSWIEQMDLVMLPILEDNSVGIFDNSLWQEFLDG